MSQENLHVTALTRRTTDLDEIFGLLNLVQARMKAFDANYAGDAVACDPYISEMDNALTHVQYSISHVKSCADLLVNGCR